jgi:hypothetical protein
MPETYTPRRASRRWLEGAPDFVLDCFDHPKFGDRYTVMFGKELMPTRGSYADSSIAYLGMSADPTHPQGVGMWGEMEAYDAMQYRYRNKHRRVRWQDLPERVRACVIAAGRTD